MFETDDKLDLDKELKALAPNVSSRTKEELLLQIRELLGGSYQLLDWQNNFLKSVRSQLKIKGYLTVKQVGVIDTIDSDSAYDECGVDYHDLF